MALSHPRISTAEVKGIRGSKGEVIFETGDLVIVDPEIVSMQNQTCQRLRAKVAIIDRTEVKIEPMTGGRFFPGVVLVKMEFLLAVITGGITPRMINTDHDRTFDGYDLF